MKTLLSYGYSCQIFPYCEASDLHSKLCLLDKIPLLGNISDTRCALRWCKLFSRLDLNWRKSDVFGVGMLIICFISWTPAVVTQLVSDCIR